MALRIHSTMRCLLVLLAVGGCGQPQVDEHPPFLLLRHSQQKQAEDKSDAGTIPAVPIGDPGDPGQPVD